MAITIAEAKELTEKVIAAHAEVGAPAAHEDFSDAFDSLGQLWHWVGAEMLRATYESEMGTGSATAKTMEAMMQAADAEGEEALHTLAQFGIRPTTIDDI